MVAVPDEVKRALRRFLSSVNAEMPIEKAFLFGSFARGDAGLDSDIDVAIVSKRFRGMRRLDIIAWLLAKTRGLSIDLQPIGMDPEDFEDESNTLAQTIASEGEPLPLN